MRKIFLALALLLAFTSCKKDECQTCTKTIGGIAGNITAEIREVCDDSEATKLEASSEGTTVWSCE
uniref:hypothetical protein n=1 Tax=Fulvivirga sp. TaxID=1931237 RepID=UPI00404B9340